MQDAVFATLAVLNVSVDPLSQDEWQELQKAVPSETIFSKTGQIITERRNRISPSKLRHLVFLNVNLH